MPEPMDPIDDQKTWLPADAPRPKTVGKWRWRVRATIAVLSWLYVLLLVGVWLVLRLQGDRWWIATLLLFGPRWLWALPLIPLLPLVIFGRRRSLGTLLVAALLLAFPIMNLRLPWRRLASGPATGQTLRLLTLNTHQGELNARGLRELIAATDPQVVVLQELDWRLGKTIFADGAWNLLGDGELCIASRYPIRRVGPVGDPKWALSFSAASYEIATPGGAVPLVNVHLTSPHVAFRNALHLDPRGSEQVEHNSATRTREARDVARAAAEAGPAVLMAGDFNMPTDSTAYRAHLASFSNAFDVAGLGFGWTYDVKLTVTRIDQILTGGGWLCRRCWVGPDLGSPHRPVIADLEWAGGTLPPVVAALAANQPTPGAVPLEAQQAAGVATLPAAAIAPAVAPAATATAPRVPAPVAVENLTPDPIAVAVRERQLAVGMTIEQAAEALRGWEGPVEIRARLDDGSKLFRWRKGEERIGAAFDRAGRLKSFQRL